MAASNIVFLMYHELELEERKLCQSEPGYVRYILLLETFRSQMQWLKSSGLQGLSVSEALKFPAKSVCITFDDGSETDLIAAAPILQEHGFHATFYITAGFLGTPGYLTADQLRKLDAAGFEIGCHSMTHPYLPDLTEQELKREIVDAKLQVEQVLGHGIEHYSCPGGRYDRRTLEMARRAGFRSVANSLFHANSPQTDRYELGRVALLRQTSVEEFGAMCRGQGLWKLNLQDRARHGVRRLVGNAAYDQVRGALLEKKQ
jgi:peptidoglycan/xylan/chitin deacetylase (PgdA/CDA1 family)